MTLTLWIILALQMAMGAIDTLYHHEFTERLAWRDSQAGELKLHAIRNIAIDDRQLRRCLSSLSSRPYRVEPRCNDP